MPRFSVRRVFHAYTVVVLCTHSCWQAAVVTKYEVFLKNRLIVNCLRNQTINLRQTEIVLGITSVDYNLIKFLIRIMGG